VLYPAIAGLVGGTLNTALMAAQWKEVLRLATSIQQGTVTASCADPKERI
jgi:hypothetical protein